jgi:hypothetical protein
MEAVHDPGIVALEFEEPQPGGVGLHCQVLLLGLKVNQSAPPGIVSEGTPFG